MDIYRFINSTDIAAHLKSIEYQFSAMESAWLIWQSNTATIKERHEAWLALIEKFPDCSIEKSIRHPHWESLHQMLRDYMALEEKLRAILVEQDIGAAYIYDEYGPILRQYILSGIMKGKALNLHFILLPAWVRQDSSVQ